MDFLPCIPTLTQLQFGLYELPKTGEELASIMVVWIRRPVHW